MIIDFHTHLFPKKIRDDRALFFTNEPEFKLLYDSSRARMTGAEEIIAAMDQDGVDVSVIFGFPWRNPDTVRFHNDDILAAMARYPKRLKGFCCVDALNDGAYREVARCLDAGMSGVGELAFYQSGIEEEMLRRLQPIMALCLEKDLPVMIHTNEPVGHSYPGKTPNTLAQIYQIPKWFPHNKIVLAHWGGGVFFFLLLKKEVRETLTNVYYDTAASPFLYSPLIYQFAMRLAGREKCLFGSDYPLLKPGRYFGEMKEPAAGLSQEDLTAICGLNAIRLLNMDRNVTS
ncbi:MAG: amidohydrolase family protein [Thermodesulfobacteriota bacterium]